MSHDGIVKAYLDTLGFNREKSTLSVGGVDVAYHCDKFNTRILKNIEDVMGYDEGSALLKEWASKTTYKALGSFLIGGAGAGEFANLDPEEKMEAQFELFKVLAYGAVTIESLAGGKGEFSSKTSYLAEGWLENKKSWGWTTRQGPACHDMCGHIAAAMAIAFGKPQGSYTVRETTCRTMGADVCTFEAEEVR